MRLSHLEIIGFKSFATKLDVKLSEGITAVVGPNGCGKSNIVDAIRWVLGEQRATALRGARMEDIIFNGTATRKPLGMAEVSLTIDNSEQLLPIEYSEVTISRRYFRSGESEYFINKISCRLKDITDLLLDTGMGIHAYSIIEQGMVDVIVNGSPMDRRHLIEEAAGINKYKTRRRLAERKLESTEQDLLRIADLLEEVERNASALRRQVWKYERYQRLSQDRKEVEVCLAYHEFLALRQQTEPLRERIDELVRGRMGFTNKIATLEARVETRQLELTEKERVLTERQQEVSVCDERIRELNEKALVARTRRNGLESRLESARQECEHLKTELEHLGERRARAQEEQTDLAGALEKSRETFQERDQKAKDFAARLGEKKETSRVLHSRRLDLIQKQTEKRGEVSNMEHRLEALRNRQNDLEKIQEKLDNDLKDLDARHKSARQNLRSAGAALEENQQLKTTLEEDLRARQLRREELRETLSELDAQLVTRDRELGLLRRMQQKYEGYGQGVRALLVDGPEIRGLRGTLADRITVDQRYADVVERYLHDALQFIVATTTGDALAGLEHLNTQRAGSASFLMMDRLKARPSSPEPLPAPDPGIIGRVSEFVTAGTDMQPLIAYLLDNAVLVDSRDTALRLADRFNNGKPWRLLCLTGEIVDPAGVLTGGQTSQEDAHLLSRMARIETLDEEIEEGRRKRETTASELARVTTELNGLLERRTVLDRVVAEQQRAHLQADQQVRQLEFQKNQLAERVGHSRTETEQLAGQADTLIAQLSTLKESLSALVKQREEAENADQEATEELSELEAENQRLAHAAHEARITLISSESRGNELRTTIEHLAQQADRLNATLDQRQQEIEQNARQTAELRAVLEQSEQQLKELYGQRREKELLRDAALNEHRAIQDDMRTLQQETGEARNALSLVQEQIHQAELQETEWHMKGQEIRRMMMQQHDTDPENMAEMPVIAGLETFDSETARGLILDSQRKIEELGPINMAAVEEYNASKERLDFLTQQRDDLVEAKQNLESTIIRMNRAARARFLDTFEEVRHNFMKTFQALFEGGEADLSLEEGDPLEAGIEIMARPRGKRLQNIGLLSGGETALTAIALLFAIYLVKPSPFCIFDEVDAPLDDANVRRFAAALRQFAHHTQFVVVTHNKRTMEAADYLYGITMEEPGMSRMVSVRLQGSPADQMTPTPVDNGNGAEHVNP